MTEQWLIKLGWLMWNLPVDRMPRSLLPEVALMAYGTAILHVPGSPHDGR